MSTAERILIVARTGHFGDEDSATAELFVATSIDEANRFCTAWRDNEVGRAQDQGGYPGEAFVVGVEPESAAKWLTRHEEEADDA